MPEQVARALDQLADLVDRGPAVPLPPSVFSALIRERAQDVRDDDVKVRELAAKFGDAAVCTECGGPERPEMSAQVAKAIAGLDDEVPAHAAFVAGALHLARSLDTGVAGGGMAIAAIARELKSYLEALTKAGGDDDLAGDLASFLTRMSTPVVNPPAPGPADARPARSRSSRATGNSADAVATPRRRRSPGDRS